jgi:hypothetical protein
LAAMADTLKYLQELDRYYSQVARPRSVVWWSQRKEDCKCCGLLPPEWDRYSRSPENVLVGFLCSYFSRFHVQQLLIPIPWIYTLYFIPSCRPSLHHFINYTQTLVLALIPTFFWWYLLSGFHSRCGQWFFSQPLCLDLLWVLPSLLSNLTVRSFPGIRWPKSEADPFVYLMQRVNAWSHTSTPPNVFIAWCLIKHRET